MHEVSLYLVDFDDNGRSESIEVLNAETGAVLDSPQTVSNFAGGEYLTWNLKGNVEFVITDIAGTTAVVSGIFFGGATPTATFSTTDMTTQGNWQGTYGLDGENVIGSGTTNYPAYAQVTVSGNTTTTTWAASTTDVRALEQPPSGTGRVAAAWQSSTSFTIDVDLTDTQLHEVSLYLVDFDYNGRTESIEVVNAENGAVLASPANRVEFRGRRVLDLEPEGQCGVRHHGHRGIHRGRQRHLFRRGSRRRASYVATDATTQGNWQGTYGVDGENVIGSGTTNYPAYAQVTVTGNTTTTTWAASTTDVRALEQPERQRAGCRRVASSHFLHHRCRPDGYSHP